MTSAERAARREAEDRLRASLAESVQAVVARGEALTVSLPRVQALASWRIVEELEALHAAVRGWGECFHPEPPEAGDSTAAPGGRP